MTAGSHRRQFCPVTAELALDQLQAAGYSDPLGQVVWLRDAAGRWHAAQAAPTGPGRVALTWVVDRVEAGHTLTYEVAPAGEAPALGTSGVQLVEEEGAAVAVLVDGRLFTRYHFGAHLPRPFLFPVLGPYELSVTRHFPMEERAGERRDHPHHRSLWFTHGDVNGVDNWSEGRGHGYTRHQGFREVTSGPCYGQLVADNVWTSAEGQPVVAQQTALRVYHVPEPYRLLDVTLTFRADFGPVTFGDTKEGGLVAVRVASSMDADRAGRIETATGAVGEKEAWGKRAPWCDYSGPVDSPWGGLWVGIAILDHPANPRYPTHWHVRNYGLMTANCFGLSHFTGDKSQDGSLHLPAGGQLTFRYRLWLHPGDAGEGRVADRWLDFAYPPAVQVGDGA